MLGRTFSNSRPKGFNKLHLSCLKLFVWGLQSVKKKNLAYLRIRVRDKKISVTLQLSV
jgi:hypothetical protein